MWEMDADGAELETTARVKAFESHSAPGLMVCRVRGEPEGEEGFYAVRDLTATGARFRRKNFPENFPEMQF